MAPRTRRAVASLGMVVFLGVYVWAAIAVADLLPESRVIDALYFVIAGTAWGLPLFPLIQWAERKD
ncbi:MAG: DUF2842 domain-containing protein [Caulobacteraceae bacterium]|nr:DUF2842 domain-containing protein [Caulobacteraceae bacterium]